jgi:ABC-2 type transport system permease protein
MNKKILIQKRKAFYQKWFISFLKYLKTIQMSMRAQTNGGIIYHLPSIVLKLVYLLPLMFLWRVLAGSGVDVGMSLNQMLTYTYMNALLIEMLAVRTFASNWNYDGKLVSLFGHPISVLGQIAAQSIGSWIPMLLLFSLPMLCIAPFLGINIVPATLWFFPSLLLCISLGFGIDYIFTCITIRLRGAEWLSHVIRMAIVSFFSGTVLPFRILPAWLAFILESQPFGSLGGAPLSLFVGTTEPARIISTQIFWNLIIWPAAIIWFRKSQERIVSYGG